MSLPDGIYTREYKPGEFALAFVKAGRWDGQLPFIGDGGLPIVTNGCTWTRVADLPDLRMAEPQQIGYPVMAACCGGVQPRVHTRIPHDAAESSRGAHAVWACEVCLDGWPDLIDPRDLTPDEIAEHNLWTGGAR
jgi:hypothetical protein